MAITVSMFDLGHRHTPQAQQMPVELPSETTVHVVHVKGV